MVDLLGEILKRIKDAEKEISEAIASGVNIHNFDTYQRFVGKREGISEALALINTVLSEDEEDLQRLRKDWRMPIDFNKDDEPDLRSEQECFPDIDPGVEILGDRVLVQLRREKITSKGGIILVDETRQTLRFNETVAKVRDIGPLAYKSPEDLTPWVEGPWCRIGDLVRTIKYGGDRFVVQPDDDGAPVVFITLQAREVISKIKSFEYAQKMKAFVD